MSINEYDRLVGILAFQLRMASAGSLALYTRRLESSPDLRLLDFLIEVKALGDSNATLLLQIADSIVHAHDQNIAAAIESFGGAEAIRGAFGEETPPRGETSEPHENDTLLAERLPHGLPRPITPETAGRYTGGSEYARGGIGRILLVHDEQIGRHVILKELLPQSSVSPADTTLSQLPGKDSPGTPIRQSAAMMARFLQEAKITGQLEHPSIVPVYELGLRTNGQLYYTMKLVRGNTLAHTIAGCKSLDDRLALMRSYLDICHAMAYAHAKGIIHRDLKPSNVMVGEFGECVVLDWGLAKSCKATSAQEESFAKSVEQLQMDSEIAEGPRTRTRDVLGTPLYMSPEQARADSSAVGYHSDVYSLGVILFEILANRLPHQWSNTLDTVRRVGSVPPPAIRSVAPETPPELAAICDKALAFEAGRRYPSARELAEDVERFLEGAVVDAYAYRMTDMLRRTFQRHKALVTSTGLAALAILIVGIASYASIYRANIAAENARVNEKNARLDAEEKSAIADTQRARAEAERAVAVAERTRAEAAEDHAAREKYAADIRLAEAHIRNFAFQAAEDALLETTLDYRGLEWEFLLGKCNQELRAFQEGTEGIFALPSHGGNRILSISAGGFATLWDSATGQSLHTWNVADARLSFGAFSPDDAQVALWSSDGRVHLFAADSGAPLHAWKAHGLGVLSCAFSEDGSRLVTAGGDTTIRVWKLDTFEKALEIPAQAALVKFVKADSRILALITGAPIALFDAASGRRVASGPSEGRAVGVDGGLVAWAKGADLDLLSENGLNEQFRVTPGAMVQFARYFPVQRALLTASSDRVVRLWSAENGKLEQTFNFGDPIAGCHLDPTGATVVVLSRKGRISVFGRSDGAERLELGSHRGEITTSYWLPGNPLLLTGSLDGSARLWPTDRAVAVQSIAGTPPEFVPASFSETGDRIAMAATDGRIQVVDLAGGAVIYQAAVPVHRGGSGVTLSSDGRRLGAILDDFLAVVIALPDGAVISELQSNSAYANSIRFSPDGAEVVLTARDRVPRRFSAETGALIAALDGHSARVTDAVYSPDGTQLVTLARNGEAALWDRSAGAILFTMQLGAPVVASAFSPGGKLLAVASRNGEIQIWDTSSQSLRHTMVATQTARVATLAFSAGGDRLVATFESGPPAVWDTALGLYLCELRPPDAPRARWHAFHGPSGTLYTGTQDGAIEKHIPLAEDPKIPTGSRAALEPVLTAYRAQYAPARPPTKVSEAPYHAYLPGAAAAELIAGLASAAAGAPAEGWRVTDETATSAYHPLPLRAGDVVTTFADAPLQALLAPESQSRVAQWLASNQPLSLDVRRGAQAIRYVLDRVPDRTSERTVTLSRDEARAMVDAALAYLERDGRSLLQLAAAKGAQRGIATGGGAESQRGYWIPALGDPEDRDLLRRSGLEVGMRLLAVDNQAPPNMDGIVAMLESARARLDTGPGFQLNLDLECGAFERVRLSIQSSE